MINVYIFLSLVLSSLLVIGLKKQNRLHLNKYNSINILIILLVGPGLLPYFILRLKPYWNRLKSVDYPQFIANQSNFFTSKRMTTSNDTKNVFDFKPKKKFDFRPKK